jgi:hypothetical protein
LIYFLFYDIVLKCKTLIQSGGGKRPYETAATTPCNKGGQVPTPTAEILLTDESVS